MPDPNDETATEMTEKLLAASSVEIYNAYLPQIKELYLPMSQADSGNRAFNIRYLNITKWVTDKKENTHVTGIVIGLTLTLVHLFGIPYTGTSVNPARSIGPALFQGGDALSQVWVFILAPMIGAALAAYFFKYILKNKK